MLPISCGRGAAAARARALTGTPLSICSSPRLRQPFHRKVPRGEGGGKGQGGIQIPRGRWEPRCISIYRSYCSRRRRLAFFSRRCRLSSGKKTRKRTLQHRERERFSLTDAASLHDARRNLARIETELGEGLGRHREIIRGENFRQASSCNRVKSRDRGQQGRFTFCNFGTLQLDETSGRESHARRKFRAIERFICTCSVVRLAADITIR